MLLSVIIPVYNERATIPTILVNVARALPNVRKEIIIVDDCSNDGTCESLVLASMGAHIVRTWPRNL
jgi:glycosyltransferase involved in cell wall biosynthesis